MSINEVKILPFSILNMGQFQENGCITTSYILPPPSSCPPPPPPPSTPSNIPVYEELTQLSSELQIWRSNRDNSKICFLIFNENICCDPMRGHNICFYGKIRKNIPKLSLLLLLIWSTVNSSWAHFRIVLLYSPYLVSDHLPFIRMSSCTPTLVESSG